MTQPRIVRFYFHDYLRRKAEAGEQNFIRKFVEVLRDEGFDTAFHDDSLAEQAKSRIRSGNSVFLMEEPTTSRGVTIRRNYFFPFWNIETTARRWDWPVARARFDPDEVPRQEAARFARHWRKVHFKGATETTSRDGPVYVPLQGRLLTQRSFQSCSPIEMIEQLLRYDPKRRIVATLHPKEAYSEGERRALAELAAAHTRLTVTEGRMIELLQTCDYVATQNSGVALSGFFFGKPAVLFGRINFHHIAANVHEIGAETAIRQVAEMAPDFDAYLWWFLQKMSINAGKPDAHHKIRQAIRRAGWIE